jgi:hypothetical protein
LTVSDGRGQASHGKRHDGRLTGHGFEGNHAERFIRRRNRADVGSRIVRSEFILRNQSPPLHDMIQAVLSDLALSVQLDSSGAAANARQQDSRAGARSQIRNCAQKCFKALDLVRSANKKDDALSI